MSGRGRRLEDEEQENGERWLVSYADMITLLAALFIVLFAMSRIDLAKFQAFAQGLRGSLGGENTPAGAFQATGKSPIADGAGALDGTTGGVVQLSPGEMAIAKQVISGQAEASAAVDHSRMNGAEATIEKALAASGLQDAVTFRKEPRGLVISVVTDDVLFESGSAVIPTRGRELLAALAPALATLPNELGVEGHTDDRPIVGGGGSNWELSAARATSVLRYLVEVQGIAGGRIYQAGYGDQRPLVTNDSAEHRAMNRRVEIVVLAQGISSPGVQTAPDAASKASTTSTPTTTVPIMGPMDPANPIGQPVPTLSPHPVLGTGA